ncbi:hypothetical protein C8R34_10916 [Nitrosomonas sp. Nm84]|nr:hypothetical protein [Nitrosomonas sp. Nm84]PXW87768.1 hypothetical protein C8R34_10916 [Nitrosomonas sp. Nm84]
MDMSSSDKTHDSGILKNMGINIIVIFGVLVGLIIISSHFAG